MKLDKESLPFSAWFLDFDGSLCPHQEVWEERCYDPEEIYQVLSLLRGRSQAVLWNTGRRVESLGGVDPRYLEISGYFIQGSLYWDAEKKEKQLLAPPLGEEIIELVSTSASELSDVRIEVKPTSMRIAPTKLSELNELRAWVDRLQPRLPEEYEWVVGHRGAELLRKGFDKAFAIRRELKNSDKKVFPVVVADDILDRPAVRETLERGGVAVLVGEGCGWVTEIPHRPEQLIFCETPERVHRLIESLI